MNGEGANPEPTSLSSVLLWKVELHVLEQIEATTGGGSQSCARGNWIKCEKYMPSCNTFAMFITPKISKYRYRS
ncbi:hypothetical protein PAECIP111894_05548 [Paenibacillus pseudetheri]|uniref:Uncharacterized protein n=1 Tax=Paenibacillus pseudetheri TaxID=2897682 RepID=A0ABM9BJU5_9BACL|nr:hypothetical protein PAECIP111894_05548 [Paenibacillus pseudetheri]